MQNNSFAKTVVKFASQQKALVAVLAMLVMMLFFPTNFYTPFNLFDLLNSSSILIILAFYREILSTHSNPIGKTLPSDHCFLILFRVVYLRD